MWGLGTGINGQDLSLPVNIESLRTDLTTDQERRIIIKIIEMGYVDKSETIEKKLQSLDHKVEFSLDQKDTHQ